jgi:uncharacterized membrane protein
VGVGLALVEATNQTALIAGVINGATVLSVSLSWAAVHTVFALRYARLYSEEGGIHRRRAARGGGHLPRLRPEPL